jgi:hypothetical protein
MMDEIFQQQQEQDNESGIDMHDCYHACHPLNILQGEEKWKSGAQNERKQNSGSESQRQAAAGRHTVPF